MPNPFDQFDASAGAAPATAASNPFDQFDTIAGNAAMAGDAGVPDFGNDRPAPVSGMQRLPEGEFSMGGSEVPRLTSSGAIAPTPTNQNVQALQFSNANAAPGQILGTAADFDAQFGRGAATQYAQANTAPTPPSSWLQDQLGATNDQGYGQGIGYLIDNPLTRGLGNAAASTDAGLAYLVGKGADALGLDSVKQFSQGAIADDLATQQALAAPRDAGIGALATQGIANLGGQLAIGGMTGGQGAAAQGVARVGLMDAAKAALASPATRMAGTLGVTQAGNEAARMEAEGHPVSGSQFGTMALTDTSANLVPLAGRWNIPARVASGAVVGEATNEASNVAAGRPLGTGALMATSLGGALGLLPGHHSPTLADEGRALAQQVMFGNRVDFLRDATARQDLDERIAAAAQQNGGVVHPDVAAQLADQVANDHGTSVDTLLRAPRNPMEAGTAAADDMLAGMRQTLAVKAAEPITVTTGNPFDRFDTTTPGEPVAIQTDALTGVAPRAPALPDTPAGVSRDDLVRRWREAQTDGEKASASANIAAFDLQSKRQPAAPAWSADLNNIPDLADSVRAGLRDRYTRAEQTLPVFDTDVRQIADSVGGRAIVAPLKGVERAAAKVVTDYSGDASQIKDLVRGTIEMPDHADASNVVDQLRAKYGEPLKLKNSLDPNQAPPFANGYRDINSVWSINGEPVELQINVPEMLEAKHKAHPLYAEFEKIRRTAVEENRVPTPEENARLRELDAQQSAIYQPAWDAAMRRTNSSRGITSASSRKLPLSSFPSGQVRQTYSSSDASLPSGMTPNTALGPNSGSEAGRIDTSAMGATSTEILPSTQSQAEVWSRFPPDSETLGIPRAEMPQIKVKDRNAFLDYLDSKGIGHQSEDVPASSLKPTQAEFSPTKVAQFGLTGFGKGRSVMISSDGHVLDGHHQWLAHRDAGLPIPVIRIDAPIRDVLKAANEFPQVQRSPGAEPTANQTADHPIVETPLSQLKLSGDVPQFKSGADENGVVEQLGGKYDRRGTGPIQVWRRKDGSLEVISGRHRLDLARRSGEQTIPSQIYNEADGFTARHAAALDAELNIRDGQGKVADYVQYFQNAGITRAEADARGLLARATGKRAYTLATQGGEDLVAAHRAGRLTDEAAVQIAQAAPGDERLQALGMKLVQDGKPIAVAANTMRAVKVMAGDKAPGQGDIFGFNDSAIREAVDMARVASTKQRELGEQIAAVSGAAKRPEQAKALGVNVKDPAGVQQRVEELKAERAEWDNWASNPRLMSEVRSELGLDDLPQRANDVTAPDDVAQADDVTATMFSRYNNGAGVDDMFGAQREPERAAPKPAASTGDMFGGPTARDHLGAAERTKDAQRNGLAGGRGDAGDGGLFDGKRPEQVSLTDVPKASRDTAQGERVTHTADQVRDAARKGWGNRFIAKLERAGVLHFMTADEAVARGLAKSTDELAGVKGLYADGKAYVLTDQVRDLADVPGIVVHEAGLHYGYDHLTKAEERQALRNRVNRALAAGDPDIVKAWQHAEKVGTPARALHEEAMAYLVENAPGHDVVTRMLDAVKRGLNRLGVPLDVLESNTDAIRRTARDMLRRAANPEANPGRVRVDADGAQPWRASTIDGAPVFSRDLLGQDDSQVAKVHQQAAIARTSVLSQLAAQGYGQGALGWTGNPNEYGGWRGGVQKALAALSDKMDPVRRAEQAIEGATGRSIADDADAYRLENLMHGRAADRLDALDRTAVKPLMKSMKQQGISPKLLMDFLYARHAPERNARIASINKDMPDGGSGMSTQQAQNILAGRADGVYSGQRITPDLLSKLQTLAARVDHMRDQTLATLENSGQITPALAASLRKQWQHYVPLRGKEGEADTGPRGAGRGVDIKGKPVKRALGRGDGNTAPPNILAEIVGDAQRAIIQAEKARVGRAVLKLAAEHPNPDVWQVEPVDLEWKFSESTGEAYLAARKPNTDKDVLTVVHEGTPYHVRLVDPRIRDAVLNLGAEQAVWLVNTLGKFNRWISAVSTRYNPAFTPINAIRDMTMGMTGLMAEHGPRVAADAAKLYLPAMRASWRDARSAPGDANVPNAQKSMDDWAREFAENGGKTGIVHFNDIEDTTRHLEDSFKSSMELLGDLRPLAAAGKALEQLAPIVHVVEHANDAVENALRLAAYTALRKRGMSGDRAAAYAKDLTVNFNRKGQWAGVLNSLYLFYNASAQGVRRGVTLMRNPKVAAFLGSLAALQAAQTAVLMSRQGEDGVSDWDAIPDWKKQRSLLIALPGQGNYFALPMPYEFGFMTFAGGRITQSALGDDPAKKNNLVNDLGVGLLGSFSPIPLDNGPTGLVPEAIKVPLQLSANKNDFGQRITNEQPYAPYDMPRIAMGKASTAAPYVWLAKALNRAGGGDDFHPPVIAKGLLDWSPEDLQYLSNTFTGGLGSFVNGSWTSAQKLLAGNYKTGKDGKVDVQWQAMLRDFPIIKAFGWSTDDNRARSDRFYDVRDQVERTKAEVQAKLDDGDIRGAQEVAKKAGVFADGMTIKTNADGTPATRLKHTKKGDVRTYQLAAVPGSLFAGYKEASSGLSRRDEETGYSAKVQNGVSDYNRQIQRAYQLPVAERTKAIKDLQDQRGGLMGSFLRLYEARKQAVPTPGT